MTHTIGVAGVELPLLDTNDGPRLAPGGALGSLAEVVNAYLNEVLPELAERLRAGDGDGRGGVYAYAPPDGVDVEVQSAPWRSRAGTDRVDDPVQVGSPISPPLVVPRVVLLEVLERLAGMQAEVADGQTGDAGTGRAADLGRLDARAAELDTMTDPAAAAACRRVLLVEMEVMGLLSGGDAGPELEQLGLRTLTGYHAAAGRLADYLTSDTRREMNPTAERTSVAGAPVSLDWFRHAPGVSPDRTALGEALLAAASLGPEPEGEFFTQWRGRWYRLRWRRDDGNTPALLALDPA